MALVNIDSAINDVIRHLEKCGAGEGVEVMSYKRNRTVSIVQLTGTMTKIIERGYENNEQEIEKENLIRHLKKLFKREFPRSRKVRLFKFADADALLRHHQKI